MEEETNREYRDFAEVKIEGESSDVETLRDFGGNKGIEMLLTRLSEQMRTSSIFFNALGILFAALLIGPCALLLWALLGRGIVHFGSIAVFILSLPFAGMGFLVLYNVGCNFWIFHLRK